ncbi:Serine/threonine-protein kinase [Dipsacomyces acuminosporus]|nr:Serine/threonine-protein kinase [Dipsacomyces acuminosporus]
MEYCSLGDLASYMRKRKEHPSLRNRFGGLDLSMVRYFVEQLGSAMRFLRSRDIIHRDIKTQNILLQPPSDDYVLGESEAHGVFPLIKIADFGFARNLPSTALAETLCGSPLYMAPEILHYEPYDAKADLWSIGAVIYEMLAGKPPFHASNHVELARVIERTNDNIVFPDEKTTSDAGADNEGNEPPSIDPVLKDLQQQQQQRPASNLATVNAISSGDDALSHLPANATASAHISQGKLGARYTESTGTAVATASKNRSPPVSGGSPRKDAIFYHHSRQQAQQAPYTYSKSPDTRNTNNRNVQQARSAYNAAEQREDTASAAMSNLSINDEQQAYYPQSQRANLYPPQPQQQQQYSSGRTSVDSASRPQSDYHQRRSSFIDEEQALAEREYVVIEKRAVEMNVLADELESSPRTPVAFYPPRAGVIQQAPGVARQMSALARAIHDAVSSQYQISMEAANGPLTSRVAAELAGNDAAAGSKRTGIASRNVHGVFNPLDAELAETFESRYSQGLPAEESTIRRMEGLAYKAFAMCYLADLKWRLLPPSATGGSPYSRRQQKQAQQRAAIADPLADPEGGFLSPSDVTIEEAFVLYLKALSLLHRAMVVASRHWAGLHKPAMAGDHSGDYPVSPAAQAAARRGSVVSQSSAGSASSGAAVVSVAFNSAVQWVRSKFNECLERAEALKQLANDSELDNVAEVPLEQVLYEQALSLSKMAAVRELKWIDPLDCDRAYQLAIWMLSAILEASDTAALQGARMEDGGSGISVEQQDMDLEDRTIIEQFIASIVKRRETLQRRLIQQEAAASTP